MIRHLLQMSQVMGFSIQQQRALEAKKQFLDDAEAENERERKLKMMTSQEAQSTNELAQNMSMSRQKKRKGKKSVETSFGNGMGVGSGIKTYYRDVPNIGEVQTSMQPKKEKTRSLSLNR
jgi:hypothetical protein